MNLFRNILNNNKLYFIPYLLFFLICVLILLSFSKSEIHIWSNTHNSPTLDTFFKYLTWLGDGAIVIPIGVLFLLYNYKSAIFIVASNLLTGIPVQLMKRVIFEGTPRPKLFFEGKYTLHLIEGVEVHSRNSFPSGHSASAFAFFLCLAIIVKYKALQPIFFVLACLVAYSRIYLSQHFLIDVTVGSFIGVIVSLLCFWYLEKINKSWMEKSLIDSISNRYAKM